MTATWSGIPAPSMQDWVGLYTPTGGDLDGLISWRYLDVAAASGSVPFTIMNGLTPGIYQLRLFSNNGYAKLATSNNFTVNPRLYGETATNPGWGDLSGVTFTVTNGGTCTNSNASGAYTCTVPLGWSGSVTPSFPGYIFVNPPSRSYTNVTIQQTGQNFYAALAVQVSGTVTIGGAPLAGVAFAATNNGSCTSSNASGEYTCNVPKSWSGSVTPSLAGYTFTPAVRNHPNVGWGETGQNFTATATGSTGTVFYIHPDHLNTPRLIANGAGQAVWRWDQADPFGGNVPNENPSGLGSFTCNLRLPGQYFDKETNLHYNYFRDYDPGIGRYVQGDPLGVLTTRMPTPTTKLNHPYLYANGNPLTYIDPSGEQAVLYIVGGCVVVATTVYFVYRYNKAVKCLEECLQCPNNPTRDPNVVCQPPTDDGNTGPTYSCRTYCGLGAFAGPRGKGAPGSRDYP